MTMRFQRRVLAAFVLFAGAPVLSGDELPRPWDQINLVSQGDYFSPLAFFSQHETRYKASPQRNDFLQAQATLLSYAGRSLEALRSFDEMVLGREDLQVPPDLAKYEALTAVDFIVKEARDRRVVMVNEAHHVPETRALTAALLRPLYEAGYRYFAAETLQASRLYETLERGFPLRSTGFYTAEPIFADIVREALKIGYTLVPYEHIEPCDYSSNAEDCQNKREMGQARNLVAATLKKDPSAKILVHAGYGHIDEMGLSAHFPWIPMAKFFKELSGLDPLTVDQATFHRRGWLDREEVSYRRVLRYFKKSEPFLLRDRSNQTPWSGLPGHYDIQVFLPADAGERLDWVAKLTGRESVMIKVGKCAAFPCLIQALKRGEETAESVPFDQFYLPSSQQNALLFLREGEYTIRFISEKGTSQDVLAVPSSVRTTRAGPAGRKNRSVVARDPH